jgi:UPF0755 protein
MRTPSARHGTILYFCNPFFDMPEVSKTKLAFFLVGSMLTITFTFYAYQIIYTPNILVDREDRLLIIRSGSTLRSVQEDLGNGGFVNDMVSFSFLARLMNYDKEIRPGRYYLHHGMTNLQAIKVLKSGKQERVKVVFTYVRLRRELDEKITKNIGLRPAEFDGAIDHFIATNREGFTADNVLCMFIPNTYEVYFNIGPDELIDKMHDEYETFWTEERKEKAREAGLTPIEVSILASIVQAETVKQDEAPTIAGLYINRLKKDIALQADPTIVYAVGDFTLKRVLNGHKEVNSPYNTYKHVGLPPGPINVPQISMIDAVLNYQKHKYFYMCAKEDFSGYHNFSTNLAEHNQNARRYQHALDVEMKKAAGSK